MMICDICHKNNATVHLTEIIDNKITKLHLCEECAKKKGAEMEEHFGLNDLLAGLADFGGNISAKKERILKCPKCGMTYDDFKNTGRLGCGDCYASFETALAPLLKRIHGSAEHLGKSPAKVSRPLVKSVQKKKRKGEENLDDLKARLQSAIKLEKFEEAAGLRDRIRGMEQKKK